MRLLSLVFALGALPLMAQNLTEGPLATPPPLKVEQHQLTNDAVIRMVKAKLDDAIIIQAIRTNPGDYQTGPDDLIALKQAGVTQPILSAMLAAQSGMQTRASAPVAITDISPTVDDIGVYYKMANANSSWEMLPLELVNYRSGGAAKSIFTNGIIKKDMNGNVAGGSSKLQLKPGDHILIFAPEGVQPQEYILIKFKEKGDRREFRTETGNVFHSTTGADRDAVPFDAHRVAPHMYQFDVPEDLKPGEYGVLPPGGANQRGMANAGKIFTFSIRK